MSITTKLGEQDITDAVMYILLEANRELTTSTVKAKVRELLEPAGKNLTPLLHRNDEVIDQIIRNIVSHRDNSSNIINLNYINYKNGFWSITETGKQHLHKHMKDRFTVELS